MIHDQKIKQFRRKRSDNVQSKSKLFFEEYSYEIFDRISLIKNEFENGITFGFRNIEQKSLQLYKSKAKQWKRSKCK